mgnify:CR=1 FL=1
MKKILILSCLFLFVCESLGVFSHEHEEHDHLGICVRKIEETRYDKYQCFSQYTEKGCLGKEHNEDYYGETEDFSIGLTVNFLPFGLGLKNSEFKSSRKL